MRCRPGFHPTSWTALWPPPSLVLNQALSQKSPSELLPGLLMLSLPTLASTCIPTCTRLSSVPQLSAVLVHRVVPWLSFPDLGVTSRESKKRSPSLKFTAMLLPHRGTQ